MWRIYKDFLYKEMKYENSCFPCSLHTILANLKYVGYKGKEETIIEDLWDTFHGDLNKSAPNEEQVHMYLSNTPFLCGRASLYTPTSFLNKEAAQAICEKIKNMFIKSRKPVGMIAGIGHAHVFYKMNKKREIHFNPSTEHETITCECVDIKDIRVLKSNQQGVKTYAIGIDYQVNDEIFTHAADFILIIQ